MTYTELETALEHSGVTNATTIIQSYMEEVAMFITGYPDWKDQAPDWVRAEVEPAITFEEIAT